MENYIGQTLSDRYEVREVIGTGGMAVVYKAYCTILHRYVAIKVLKDEFASDEEFRKRFYNEAQAVAKLSHNNIVSIYDVCQDEKGPEYIVMELCEGVTLKDYLRKKHHLTWQETLFFSQQVARALDHAHSRGIIHQDIKPQNIMLLRDGTAKVMDFGIARFANNQDTRKVSGEAIGSVHYISPEQAKGATVDYRADLYSLGVVMYEMLTGTLPFRGETAVAVIMQHLNYTPPLPSELVPGIPHAMDEIVMHAMCANINQRYGSAMDLCRDIERLRSNPNLVLHYSEHSGIDETRAISREQVEERTQYISQSGQKYRDQPEQDEYDDEDDDYDDYEEKRSGKGKTIAITAAVVVVIIAIAYFVLSGQFGKADLIEVPDLISLNYETEVKDNSQYSDFDLKVVTRKDTSGSYTDGEIIDQDPKGGTQAEKGSTIVLTVVTTTEDSDTDTMVTVPAGLAGKTYEEAQSALRARGLNAARKEEHSETIEEGYVIETDPEAGSEVPTGSTVSVIVSSGPENTNKSVPDLTGMTQSAAKALLESYGLELGDVDQEETESAPEGTVIDQSVSAGTEVAEGTSIDITIAIAPEPEPETEPDEEDPGAHGSSDASASISNSAVTVSLPTDRDTCTVSVSVGGNELYNHTVRTSNGTAVCHVSYSSPQRVVVRVDGDVILDEEYDFS